MKVKKTLQMFIDSVLLRQPLGRHLLESKQEQMPPFICIQLAMVAAVMIFPGMVTHYKSELSTVDPDTVEINIGNTYGNDYGYGSPEGNDNLMQDFK